LYRAALQDSCFVMAASASSKKYKMMILLFFVALLAFGYMCYVLLKPEKF